MPPDDDHGLPRSNGFGSRCGRRTFGGGPCGRGGLARMWRPRSARRMRLVCARRQAAGEIHRDAARSFAHRPIFRWPGSVTQRRPAPQGRKQALGGRRGRDDDHRPGTSVDPTPKGRGVDVEGETRQGGCPGRDRMRGRAAREDHEQRTGMWRRAQLFASRSQHTCATAALERTLPVEVRIRAGRVEQAVSVQPAAANRAAGLPWAFFKPHDRVSGGDHPGATATPAGREHQAAICVRPHAQQGAGGEPLPGHDAGADGAARCGQGVSTAAGGRPGSPAGRR